MKKIINKIFSKLGYIPRPTNLYLMGLLVELYKQSIVEGGSTITYKQDFGRQIKIQIKNLENFE